MSAHPNAELIRRFYDAFAARDGEAMAACYAPDVRFSDPVFPDLRGPMAGHMWRMLVSRASDLEIEASDIEADGAEGGARWEARYTFSATGRLVVNRIEARFRFQDGRIVEHTDRFDFHAWARQALGPAGLLLGWTGWMQGKVQAQAAAGLAQFVEKRGLPREAGA